MGIFDSLSKKIDERAEGIKPSDLLNLPKSLRTLMLRINRVKVLTLEAAAEHAGRPLEETQQDLELLVEKGYLQYDPLKKEYRVRYGRTNPANMPGSLWASLDEKTQEPEE
jgi:hypothetical protein